MALPGSEPGRSHVRCYGHTFCTSVVWWLLCVGQKNLNCCKKDQISLHSLLVTPFCGEIMNVFTCGVPHKT